MKDIEVIKERVDLKIFDEKLKMYNGIIKPPECGLCTLVVGFKEMGYEHISVSPTKKSKMPTWNDMAYLKDIFFEDEEEAYQIIPKKSQYVNIKENCLHIWKPMNGKTLNDVARM